jgi:hypothetical protein
MRQMLFAAPGTGNAAQRSDKVDARRQPYEISLRALRFPKEIV